MSESASPVRPPRKQTGVPRRFGVAVLLVITTMYAVLFAGLKQLIAVVFPESASSANIATGHAMFFVEVVGFFTIVGLAQAVLFKGRNPRAASITTGIVLSTLIVIVGLPVARSSGRGMYTILFFLYYFTGCGALPGYLAGGLIAGVFLLFNKIQPPLEDPDDEEPGMEKKIPDSPASGENHGSLGH